MSDVTVSEGREELEALVVVALRRLARERDIPGRSRLSKAELIEALIACEDGESETVNASIPVPAVSLRVLPLDPTTLHARWSSEEPSASSSPVVLQVRDVTLIEFDPRRSHETFLVPVTFSTVL